MEEPSVLDYVKSKLTFWRKSSLHLPSPNEDEPDLQPLEPQTTTESVLAQSSVSIEEGGGQDAKTGVLRKAAPSVAPGFVVLAEVDTDFSLIPLAGPSAAEKEAPAFVRIPWLAILGLVLVLLAQWSLEPRENRGWINGAVLYALAFFSLIWAYIRSDWLPSPLPEERPLGFSFTFNRGLLLISAPLALVSFLAFGGGMFTPLNLALWALTLYLFVRGLWVSEPHEEKWYSRAWRFISQPRWGLIFSRWTLILLVVVAVVIFYRSYRLDQVPSDMISDHAEKLLDVFDVLNGKPSIYFPRNTGREAFQFYLTAAIIQLFNTGFTFMSLKIGTVLAGLATLPFIYLLGKELGNRRVGLYALIFAGIAYWPNVISRFGLRFPLYPLFVAPTLYFLIRGLRNMRRNDFILAGIFLGIGLHGYTPIRALPFVVILAVFLYILHSRSKVNRGAAVFGLIIVGVVSLLIFIPLLRYALASPDMFFYRTATRMGTLERPLPGSVLELLLKNTWNAMTMFFWSDGNVWVHSVSLRPALDFVSGGLFFAGFVLVLIRYIHRRNWVDLFLLLSIPALMAPSILSLAFPDENPNLNRTAGAIIPVFILVGLALDGLLSSLKTNMGKRAGLVATWVVGLGLCGFALNINYDLVFNQYARNFTQSAWNTSEMGEIMQFFAESFGSSDSAWVVAYPHWVDTRLVGINAGLTTRDFAIWPDKIPDTAADPRAKLFLVNPNDKDGLNALQQVYPQGILSLHQSRVETKDFVIFMVPPRGGGNGGN